jgi:hypothetical protein
MCFLMGEEYPTYNEALHLNKDINLMDEKGGLIGRFSAK